jgi:hypothetical protein
LTAAPLHGDNAAMLRAALSCSRPGCACTRGPNTHCPAHEDRTPSFTVHDDPNGRLLVNCKTGCPQPSVIAALRRLGLWGADVPPPVRPVALETLTEVYAYVTAEGELVGEKGRWDRPDGSKRFAWRRPGATGWPSPSGIKVADMPLWGAELLASWDTSAPVIVCEGEKATEAARAAGLRAVCGPGGASTTDFGTSLEALRGFDVLLWPDNDAAGRQYMSRLHGLLQPIAASVRVLEPAVAEKGDDAADYFARGGSIEALFANLAPTRMEVRELGQNAVQIRYPTAMGVVAFTITEMEKTGREFGCEFEVQLEGPGMRRAPYSQRLNLLSGSQRTELRRDLEAIFGKSNDGWQWPAVLNEVIAAARATYLNQDRALRFRDIPDVEERPFMIDLLLPAGSPVLMFADGSSGKTYIALYSAIHVALGHPMLGLPVQRGAVMFIDYEDDESTFKFRLSRLLRGLGYDTLPDLPIFYWPARGIPLHDQMDTIRAKVEKEAITFVIIDAAADACGGEPESAANALRYFNALDKLPDGVASLTLAHVTNNGSRQQQVERAFGSAYWHNRPRRTWYVAREQEEESDVVDIGLYCKKVNDGRKPAPLGLRLTFEGRGGPVVIERADIRETPALQQRRPLRYQIWDVLDQPLTPRSIAALVDASVESVAARLRGTPAMFERVGDQAVLGGAGKEVLWKRRNPTKPVGLSD